MLHFTDVLVSLLFILTDMELNGEIPLERFCSSYFIAIFSNTIMYVHQMAFVNVVLHFICLTLYFFPRESKFYYQKM